MLSSVRFAFIFRFKLAYNQNSLAHYTKGNESPHRDASCSRSAKFQTVDPWVPPCTFPYGTLFTIDNLGLYPWVKVDLHYSDDCSPYPPAMQRGTTGLSPSVVQEFHEYSYPPRILRSSKEAGRMAHYTVTPLSFATTHGFSFDSYIQGTKMVQFP